MKRESIVNEPWSIHANLYHTSECLHFSPYSQVLLQSLYTGLEIMAETGTPLQQIITYGGFFLMINTVQIQKPGYFVHKGKWNSSNLIHPNQIHCQY